MRYTLVPKVTPSSGTHTHARDFPSTPEMAFSTGRLISFLFCVLVVHDFRLSAVTCQDEEGSQCLPKKTFLALLRLPEVNSNLAAYSRTARIINDSKNRNDIAHLKALSSEESDDAEICIPANIYVELFRNSAMRDHLSAIERGQKMMENRNDRGYDSFDDDSISEAEKRSLATLAKNDDLPVTIRDRKGKQEGDKRSVFTGQSMESLLEGLLDEQTRRNMPDILQEYTLPNGEIDLDALTRDYSQGKRNIASLARDYGLPSGKRNVASLARDFALPNGKRNIGALAREHLLPSGGKRNIASLARVYMLPQNGKRNIAALARDYSLPSGKRYAEDLSYDDYDDEEKRNIASLARNADWPGLAKRSVVVPPGRVILRILTRHGRSLNDRYLDSDQDETFDLQKLAKENSWNAQEEAKHQTPQVRVSLGMNGGDSNHLKDKNDSNSNAEKRRKRQIDFSGEYPLPVMQNANVLDYEELIEALTGRYPNTEKRFMGSEPEVEASDLASYGYPDAYQPSKRHIGALARLGWLPSFRSARFSRSPRYLVARENPADGPTSNYASNAPTRTLNPLVSSRTRYLRSSYRDCPDGSTRYLLLPSVDNILSQKIRVPRRIK